MPPIRILSLVVGYLPGLDRWPRIARRHAMRWRFAFAINSYDPKSADPYFDFELYAEIVASLWRIVGADRLDAIDENGDTRTVREIDEFRDVARSYADSAQEPLARLIYFRQNSPALVIESELWVRTGGPRPYDDSYTIAVFSQADLSERLKTEAERIARQLDASQFEVVEGQALPSSVGQTFRYALKSIFR